VSKAPTKGAVETAIRKPAEVPHPDRVRADSPSESFRALVPRGEVVVLFPEQVSTR